MKTYIETQVLLAKDTGKVDTNGEPVIEYEAVSEKAFDKLFATAKAEGKPEPEAVKRQSFTRRADLSLEDLQAPEGLGLSDERICQLVQRSLSIVESSTMRDFMLDLSQEAVDGSYDLLSAVQEVSTRKAATGLTGIAKKITGLSVSELEQLAAMVERLRSGQTTGATA